MAQDHGSLRAIVFAFLANVAIAALKIGASIFTRSTAMLAEGIHSLADSANQVLLWLGIRLGRRGPDALHPFGYGAERYFWSFVVALLLFAVGGLYSVYEGVQKLVHPHQLENAAWNLVILGVSIVLEAISWRTAVRALEPRYRSLGAFFRYVRETKEPSLIVVIFEDSAALLGLVLAFAGVTLAVLTGDARFDSVASILIGLLLVSVAYIIARETRSLLLGEGLAPAAQERLRGVVAAVPCVRRVSELRSLYVGPACLVVAVELDIDDACRSVEALAQKIDEVERAVQAAEPDARYVYVEVDRGPGTAAAGGEAAEGARADTADEANRPPP